jgi:predicted nucleic acid-binding Zn ribbon protein
MPTYEYKCKKCGTIVEAQQKITDPPLERGAHLVEEEGVVVAFCFGPLKKLISKSSFSLKGGGWAKEGYQGKRKKQG